MQTKNLIQASSNVIKITRLVKGDVVKMIDDQSYSSPEVFFGVVTDLFNSGEKSFVQIMRYQKSYNTVNCEIKTYSGDKDLNIFPATVEEITDHLADCIAKIKKDVIDDEKKLYDKKMSLQRAEEFVSGETSKKLNSAAFKEVTQEEYLSIKAAAKVELF